MFKLVQIENSKRVKLTQKERQAKKVKEKKFEKEITQKVNIIRKNKKAAKQSLKVLPKPKPTLKVGDRVRIEDGRAIGSIDKIEKNKAIVNYGAFTTNINLNRLELVADK